MWALFIKVEIVKTNYRLISISTCFLKYLKTYLSQTEQLFSKASNYPSKPIWISKKISTAQAMLDIVTAAYHNIYENLYTGLVFVDLCKAFDTVCHQIVLTKLEHYGIHGATYNLICSYLQDRKQFVSLRLTRSDLGCIQPGVQQGSSKGLLFFLIYINDLSNAVRCKPRLFSFNTCLVKKASSPKILQNELDHDLNLIFGVATTN